MFIKIESIEIIFHIRLLIRNSSYFVNVWETSGANNKFNLYILTLLFEWREQQHFSQDFFENLCSYGHGHS